MNFLEQQSKNKQRTIWLVVVFSLLLAALGFGLDVIMFSPQFFETYEWSGVFPFFTFIALIISIAQSYSGYYYGDKIILRSTQARKADGKVPEEKQLINVVNEVSIAAGVPCPEVYVIPDSDLNAFATGRNPEHASIVVTQGLLDKLNREELTGVVAHEMGHIRNHDTQLLMLMAILLGTILIFHQMAIRGRILKTRSSKKGGGVLILIWFVAALLAPIFARILSMAVSREREYLADATSAELTRNPSGLIAALQKISAAVEPTPSIKSGYAHMCIEDPKGRLVNEHSGFFADLMATHPPLEKRIEALKAMNYSQ